MIGKLVLKETCTVSFKVKTLDFGKFLEYGLFHNCSIFVCL